MTQLQNKVAIVTGASRGIGAAVADRLARDGYAVIVNSAGSAAAAEKVAGAIEARGGRALAVQADVSDPAAVGAMFDKVEAAFGGVDVVVNNAGVMTLSPLAEVTDEAFDRQFAINVKGTFNVMREAARRLRAGGSVVNFSSSVIGLRMENYAVYCATKAAVEAMTAVMSKEMRGRSIRVNAVAPGPVATELFLHGKSPDLIDRLAKLNPMERLGTPEDIAGVVSLLVGPDGSWVNGQVLRANGGMV